jgi:hypothetical protein
VGTSRGHNFSRAIRNNGKTPFLQCPVADSHSHRSPLQSDGLWVSAPAVQRFAGGAKAGGMGKSSEARGPSKKMRNGHKQ